MEGILKVAGKETSLIVKDNHNFDIVFHAPLIHSSFQR